MLDVELQPSSRRPAVLLVQSGGESVSLGLEELGCRVEEVDADASDGAIEIAAELDAVILICGDRSDLGILDRLAGSSGPCPVPALVVAITDEVTQAECYRAGAVGWLRDPVEPPVLAALVASHGRLSCRCEDAHGRMRRDAEEELRRTTSFLTTVLANAPMVTFALDRDGVFTLISGRPLESIGLVEGQLVGSSIYDLYSERSDTIDAFERALAGERNRRRTVFGGLSVDVSYSPRFDAEGVVDGVTGVALDVTDEGKLAEQLEQAQKMESVGLLAGGVAHDFNNLLTIILSAAHLIEGERVLGGESADDLRQIIEATGRAAELTRQLLAFGRRAVLEPVVLDINDTLRSLNRMLRRVLRDDVELHLRCDAGLPMILVDPSQLDQILLNLAVNAQDAMPDGGELGFFTHLREIADGEVPPLAAGPYVAVEVRDTGTGMSADVAAKVFQPFFTTKEPGKGSGLGLATSYGIARQSGGTLLLSSTVGEGSAFTLVLPASDEEPQTKASTEVASPGEVSGARILLVEDDLQIRTIVARSLERADFEVLVAANGAEAIDRLRESEVALVLTDIVMPRMGGAELEQRAREMGVGVPFVFMSGYTDDLTTRYGFESGRAHLLRKPFTPNQLVDKVRRVLAS